MTDTFTMGGRNAAFLMSEASGHRSRENGVVSSGSNLVAGQVLKLSGTELVAFTHGSTPVGILLNDCDATDADTAAAYIARDAEVNAEHLTYPADTTDYDIDTVSTALAALGIIVRQ